MPRFSLSRMALPALFCAYPRVIFPTPRRWFRQQRGYNSTAHHLPMASCTNLRAATRNIALSHLTNCRNGKTNRLQAACSRFCKAVKN